MNETKHLYSSDDKLKWFGYGEWVEEADQVLFTWKGYTCRINRIVTPETNGEAFGGHLCGYVKLPSNHPWFGCKFGSFDCDCHGGITYAQMEKNGDYWIGFDCAHHMDIAPSIEKMYAKMRPEVKMQESRQSQLFIPTYKNMQFVKKECIDLVEQVINACNTIQTI